MKPNFSIRSTLPELMDQPDQSPDEVKVALHELEVINKFLGGYAVTLHALKKLLSRKQTYKIVDYGSGGGDMMRKVYDFAHAKKYVVELAGIDINPVMIEYSYKQNDGRDIHFYALNINGDKARDLQADIIVNSLFCHHFDHVELVALIKKMHENAQRAVVINDLHRHPLAYHSIRLLTRFISNSFLVKYDGPLSVARSLSRKEWILVLNEAGVKSYSIKWFWAFRWQIILYK